MFCICSNKSIDQIVAAQKDMPLPFAEMLECYTSCLSGCGSCIPLIMERLEYKGVHAHDNG
jgi:NAD(P)H-nitrite reductase large subunit